jgi:lipocalin
VLHVDTAYEEALIGSAGRDTLWLLARRPSLGAERRQALAQIAGDHGFAVDRLRFYDAA